MPVTVATRPIDVSAALAGSNSLGSTRSGINAIFAELKKTPNNPTKKATT
jgi:hypothetical protein